MHGDFGPAHLNQPSKPAYCGTERVVSRDDTEESDVAGKRAEGPHARRLAGHGICDGFAPGRRKAGVDAVNGSLSRPPDAALPPATCTPYQGHSRFANRQPCRYR